MSVCRLLRGYSSPSLIVLSLLLLSVVHPLSCFPGEGDLGLAVPACERKTVPRVFTGPRVIYNPGELWLRSLLRLKRGGCGKMGERTLRDPMKTGEGMPSYFFIQSLSIVSILSLFTMI